MYSTIDFFLCLQVLQIFSARSVWIQPPTVPTPSWQVRFFWLHHPEMVAETMASKVWWCLMMFDGLSFWFQFSVIVLLVQHGIPYFQTNLKRFFGHCLFSDIPLWSNLMCWLRQETSRRSSGHLSAGLVQSPVGCNAPFDTALIDRFLHGVVIVMGYNMYWLL